MHDIYKNNNFFIHTLFLVVQSILYYLNYIIKVFLFFLCMSYE